MSILDRVYVVFQSVDFMYMRLLLGEPVVLESTEITVLSEDVLGGCHNAALLVHPVLLAAVELHPWLLGLIPAFSPSVRIKHTPSNMGGFLLPVLMICQEGHGLSLSCNYWGRGGY